MILPTIANAPASASALTPSNGNAASATESPEGGGFTAALAQAQHQTHAEQTGRSAAHGDHRSATSGSSTAKAGSAEAAGKKPTDKTDESKDASDASGAPSLFDLSTVTPSAVAVPVPASDASGAAPEDAEAQPASSLATGDRRRAAGVRARLTAVDNEQKQLPTPGAREAAHGADDGRSAEPVSTASPAPEKTETTHGATRETPPATDKSARASAFQSALNAAGAASHATAEATHKAEAKTAEPVSASSASGTIVAPVAVDHGPGAGTGIAPAPATPPFEGRVSAPLSSPDFAPALGMQLTLLAREGVHEARLHLNPAEMGPIAVQIAVDGSQAVVHFQAEHAATRQVLENSLPDLAAALRDGGLTLSGGSVSQQPQQRGAGEPGSEGEHWSGRIEGARGTSPSDPSLDHLANSAPATQVRRQGVVDFYA